MPNPRRLVPGSKNEHTAGLAAGAEILEFEADEFEEFFPGFKEVRPLCNRDHILSNHRAVVMGRRVVI